MFFLYEVLAVWGVFYLYSCFQFGLAPFQVLEGTWGWWLFSLDNAGLGLRAALQILDWIRSSDYRVFALNFSLQTSLGSCLFWPVLWFR